MCCVCVRALMPVCVCMCKLQLHHLWPRSQLSGMPKTLAHTHSSMHTQTHTQTHCLCVCCVSVSLSLANPAAPLMTAAHYAKEAPCLGFPLPPGKVNLGMVVQHSQSREGCGQLRRSTPAYGVRSLCEQKIDAATVEQTPPGEHQGGGVQAVGQKQTVTASGRLLKAAAQKLPPFPFSVCLPALPKRCENK